NMDKVLEVNNITKSYAAEKAVDGVSFDLCSGEILGLLGPNGAGKTTIIRMILNIIVPDNGEINFDGFSIDDKHKMGYLPEERGIYKDTKVMETIVYFADLNQMAPSESRERAEYWLEKLELADYADHKIEELSKGMQQKVQFIISIIHNPELLIVDELFSGLDPVNQDLFKSILEELVEGGMSILLSSHRMNMVEELCDRIFLINKGKQVLYGNLDNIKNNYEQKKVKMKYKGNDNYLKENRKVSNFKRKNNKVSFYLNDSTNLNDFIKDINEQLEINEISVTSPSLHDIFISSVRGGSKNE
ncbi:MAG: ABC transporter ATP-binding protein, partial [Halanaerobiales bacterium]